MPLVSSASPARPKAARTILDCRLECTRNPVQPRLRPEDKVDLPSLLLSRTAVRHPEDAAVVKETFEKLIDLRNPLINRMLEITAFSMHHEKMHIYITDYAEFSMLHRKAASCRGFYDYSRCLLNHSSAPRPKASPSC